MISETKTKNDSLWQVGTLTFIALWVASYGVGWALRFLLQDLGAGSYEVAIARTLFCGLIVPALLQVQIVERLLHRSMAGWMRQTFIGALISVVPLFSLWANTSSGIIVTVFIMCLLVPVAALQTLWLRLRVTSAWLWLLAGVMGSVVFAAPLQQYPSTRLPLILAILLYSLIQGGVMRYLWTQTRDTEKAKVDFETDEQTDEQRLQRLKTSEHLRVIAPWTQPDEVTSRQNRG